MEVLLVPFCAILADAFVLNFIVLRRFRSLCFNNRTGTVFFASLRIADAGLMSTGDGGSLVRVTLNGVVLVERYT